MKTPFVIVFIIAIILFLGYRFLMVILRKRSLPKGNLDTWMKMSREERYIFDQDQKRNSFRRKTSLINEIRKEYMNLRREKN